MQNRFGLFEKNTVVLKREQQKGFTLIELSISLVIFLIVTGAIYGLLRVAQRSRSLTNQQVHATKDIRVAMSLVGRDTYNAGYGYPGGNAVVALPDNRISTLLAIPNDYDTSRDTVPPIIAGNNVNPNTYNRTLGTKTDQVTFLFKDSTFNLVGATGKEVSTPLSLTSTETAGGIDQVVLASGSSSSVCRVNDIYVVTGGNGSALVLSTGKPEATKVQFANSDVLGFNQPGTGNPLRSITMPGTMQRVTMVTYFVTAEGTLIRREYANNSPAAGETPQKWTDEPLVYGVEDFQIRYVMDDGSISDNPSAGADGLPGTEDDVQANLAKVRQVRFTINVRTPDIIETTNQEYRVSTTSTFSTRNLGYDAN